MLVTDTIDARGALEPSLETGTFDAPTSAALDAFMQRGWGGLPDVATPPAPPPALVASRRARLAAIFAEDTLVVCAGRSLRRAGDQFFRFRTESDYAWLTGDQSPGGVLVMEPGCEPSLYLEPPSSRENGEFWRNFWTGELWVGRRATLEARSADLGLECRPIAELSARLTSLERTRFLPAIDPATIQDLEVNDVANREFRAVLSELRLVKDAWEVTQLRAAVDATTRGFDDVARLLQRAGEVSERQVEVTFDARARLEGYSTGYQTISAVGEHAATLHWTRNDGRLGSGQMLLLDAGVEVESLYTADVTRTIPVSGRFTSLQRQVYEVVLAAQNAALEVVRPGERFRTFYDVSARVLAEGLSDLGVLPVSAEESLSPESGLHRRWTLCSPGHMLGLDVHDCGSARAPEYLDGVLRAGHVLTVEPGLYFQANDELIPPELRGQGFRIEDDVLVTEDGNELLSGALPRTVDDIEGWLSSPGDR